MVKISVNMIIGEFDEPFLPYALESVKWADELVIILTGGGSNKKLLESINHAIYRSFGDDDRVTVRDYFVYSNNPVFNFADARNLAKKFSTGDYILKLDADEVYYNSMETTVKNLDFTSDCYEVEFYHFMLDIFHYQYIETKEVLFKNSPDIYWSGATHETLQGVKSRQKLHERFCHLGYVKSQKEVFKRWQKYVELEGRPEWYKGQDPEHILDDRSEVCQKFNVDYPEVIREYVKTAPRIIKDEPSRRPKIGLVMPVTDEDYVVFDYITSISATADRDMCLTLACLNLSPIFMDKLATAGHKVLNIAGKEETEVTAINKAINFYLKHDPDVRWIALLLKDNIRRPWAGETLAALSNGVGAILNKEMILICPVDVYEQIGLLRADLSKPEAYKEFLSRAKLHNFKVINEITED